MERHHIDFLVLAPLTIEIESLHSVFNPRTSGVEEQYGLKWWEAAVEGKSVKRLYVRYVELPRQGVLNAAVATTALITEWKPWCVASFGIAGGFLIDERLRRGDVVVPESVYYYEPAKDVPSPGATQSRGVSSDVAADLLVLSRNAALEEEREFRIVHPYLASGERKITYEHSNARLAILAVNDNILAVEMEAAGVAAAAKFCALATGSVRFLAVKGVSDAASGDAGDKNDEDRGKAAQFAALHLCDIVVRSTPLHHANTSRVIAEESRSRARSFLATFPSAFIEGDVDLLGLRRVMPPTKPKPSVIYHWNVRESELHWVDFANLLVLRRVSDLGFPIELLLNDQMIAQEQADSVRQGLASRVRAVVPRAQLNWYKNTYDTYKREIEDHAFAEGWDTAVQYEIVDIEPAQVTQYELWLKFVAWATADVSRCIIYVLRRNARLYDILRNFLSLHPFFLYRGLYTIGNIPAKDARDTVGIVEPPHYTGILAWLTRAGAAEASELARYLTLGQSDQSAVDDGSRLGRAKTELPLDPRLLARLELSDEYSRPALALLTAMCDWNATFFAKTEARPTEIERPLE